MQSKLAQYKGGERELTVLLENERVLSQVKGRVNEVTGYKMAGVSEYQIDEVIDEIEEAVGEEESRLDAARDLEEKPGVAGRGSRTGKACLTSSRAVEGESEGQAPCPRSWRRSEDASVEAGQEGCA